MLANTFQASDLVAHFQQALKRAEGNDDELELFSQVKLGHVRLDEMDALALVVW